MGKSAFEQFTHRKIHQARRVWEAICGFIMSGDSDKTRMLSAQTYAFMAGHGAAVILFYLMYNLAAVFLGDQNATYASLGILMLIGLVGAYGYRRSQGEPGKSNIQTLKEKLW